MNSFDLHFEILRVFGKDINKLEKILAAAEQTVASQSPYTSRLPEIRIKLPRRPILQELIREISTILPVQIRLEVERFPEIHTLPLEERRNILRLKDRIFLDNDSNYFVGRVMVMYREIFRTIQVNIVQPRQPKRTQRIRGYRDHGSLPSPDVAPRKDANSLDPVLKDLDGLHHRRVQNELEIASQLLLNEKNGVSLQDNVELMKRKREKAEVEETSGFKDTSLSKVSTARTILHEIDSLKDKLRQGEISEEEYLERIEKVRNHRDALTSSRTSFFL